MKTGLSKTGVPGSKNTRVGSRLTGCSVNLVATITHEIKKYRMSLRGLRNGPLLWSCVLLLQPRRFLSVQYGAAAKLIAAPIWSLGLARP